MGLTWNGGAATQVDSFTLVASTPLRLRQTPGGGDFGCPTLLEHSATRGMTGGTVGFSQLGEGELASFYAADTFAVAAQWGTQAASVVAPTYTQRVWANVPKAQRVSLEPGALDSKRRRDNSVTFLAAYDPSLGGDAEITVACSLATLA